MGDDDPWLRWRGLHGVSPQVNVSIDGRLICNHQIEIEGRLRAAFLQRNFKLLLSHKFPMKVMLALASGWIGFYLADQAIYGGDHVRLVAGFLGAVAAGFG
jgi:hypothetical protein